MNFGSSFVFTNRKGNDSQITLDAGPDENLNIGSRNDTVFIGSGTASSSTSTGAVVINGGIGVSGDIHANSISGNVSSFTSLVVNDLQVTDATVTNLLVTNETCTNLLVTNANITNGIITNSTLGNFAISTLAMTTSSIQNLITMSGTIASLLSQDANITNLLCTNGTIANLITQNANITNSLTTSNSTTINNNLKVINTTVPTLTVSSGSLSLSSFNSSSTITSNDSTSTVPLNLSSLKIGSLTVSSNTQEGILVYGHSTVGSLISTYNGFDFPVSSITNAGTIRTVDYNTFANDLQVTSTTEGTIGTGSIVCRGGLSTPGNINLGSHLTSPQITGIRDYHKCQNVANMWHMPSASTAISNTTGIVRCGPYTIGNGLYGGFTQNMEISEPYHDYVNGTLDGIFVANNGVGMYQIIVLAQFISGSVVGQFCRFTIRNDPNTFIVTEDVYQSVVPGTKDKTFIFNQYLNNADVLSITAQSLFNNSDLSFQIKLILLTKIY